MNAHDARLSFIARRYPYVWELIGGGPGGPHERVELNPQPLPPKAIGALVVSILVERAMFRDDFSRLEEEIDNYCGNGRWRTLILIPKPPVPDPEPDPWPIMLGAALTAAEMCHAAEPGLATVLGSAAQKLFAAGVQRSE